MCAGYTKIPPARKGGWKITVLLPFCTEFLSMKILKSSSLLQTRRVSAHPALPRRCLWTPGAGYFLLIIALNSLQCCYRSSFLPVLSVPGLKGDRFPSLFWACAPNSSHCGSSPSLVHIQNVRTYLGGGLFGQESASKPVVTPEKRRFLLPFPCCSEHMGRERARMPWGVLNFSAVPSLPGHPS